MLFLMLNIPVSKGKQTVQNQPGVARDPFGYQCSQITLHIEQALCSHSQGLL